MKTKITVDPEFKALCPKQTDEELKLLRESLLEEGCREPIMCWKIDGNPIVDGMTRYAICTEEEVTYKVQFMSFSDRQEAVRWILRNQLGRRNLTNTQRSIARGRLYNELKKDPTENLKQSNQSKGSAKGGGSKEGKKHKNSLVLPKGQNVTSGDVADTIALQEGVTTRTVKRDGKLAETVEKLTPATKTQIAGTKVENSKAELKRLAELPQKQQEKVARAIGSGKAKTVAEAKKVAKIKQPTEAETKAAEAKVQINIWAEAVGRWIGKSPSIDSYRNQWPSQQGDRVIKLATEFYEALRKWEKSIK